MRGAPECDVAVVGAGILGLAMAREVLLRRPGARVIVFEREAEPGRHQTARNSGVIHAGIYYAPGSLKARLCVEGARDLYAYCEQREIAHARCGKVIVALDASELPALRELEPAAAGIAALHSPHTGIGDFAAVARAFAADVREAGGEVRLRCPVDRLHATGNGVVVEYGQSATTARHAIACAGAFSDRLAVASGAKPDPRIVPFRGAYLKLAPERRDLVRGLIYPVPDPSLPFLGVHFSRHVDGNVYLGPTALLEPHLRSLTWPGTWRMARRWWRTGIAELRFAARRGAYVREAQRVLPDLRPEDVEPAFTGTRAQALARDGTLLDDFAFSRQGNVLHVRNAPSPAATSSLAIARYVVDEALG